MDDPTSTTDPTTTLQEEEEVEEEEEEMMEEEEDCDDDDEDEYEYEDDEDNGAYGSLLDNPEAAVAAAMVEEEKTTSAPTSTSGQYSKEAIAMSHRATSETTSGKRRLAADLHKLMCAQESLEADGFTFHPTNEDSMDKWNIYLSNFDPDSNLAKDMLVVGLKSVTLEMKFPDDYPFAPPFVRVLQPRFERRTGFVVSGALCMELLTKDGWRPTNDIESVIVSIRSLMVEGGGRLEAVSRLSPGKYNQLLQEATSKQMSSKENTATDNKPQTKQDDTNKNKKSMTFDLGSYSEAEAKDGYQRAAFQHKHGYSDDITKKG